MYEFSKSIFCGRIRDYRTLCAFVLETDRKNQKIFRNFNAFRRLLPTIPAPQKLLLECMIMSLSGSHIIEFAAKILGNNFLSLAKGLREIKEEDLELFEAVAKLLGLEQSEANFLARVDRTFRGLGIDDKHMASIGWPKLIVLCDHVSLRNLRKVLEFADEMSAKDLLRIARQQQSVATKRMVLLLTKDQYQVLADAILAHGGARSDRTLDGLSGKEDALVKALTSKTV